MNKKIRDVINKAAEDTHQEKINWQHAERVAQLMVKDFIEICEGINGQRLGEIDMDVLLKGMYGDLRNTSKVKKKP